MTEQLLKRILDAVDDKRVIEFEQSIVRIPSFTTEETPLAHHIADYMRKIGGDLKVELQEVPQEGGKVSYNVIARLLGTGGGPTLLLFGHMDHLPYLGRQFVDLKGWKHDPFAGEIEGEWLYGKGCQDEKGGITGLVMAAEALVKAGVKLKGDVIFATVQGHKRRSTGTLYMLGHGMKADYAINTENSGSMIVPAFVGRSEGKIHIRTAPELHFSIKETFPQFKPQLTVFELMNAIQRALGREMHPPGADSWMTFEPHPDLPGYPKFRMEIVEFHGLGHLVLYLQIRTVPGMTDATMSQDLRRLLSALEAKYPYLKTEVEWPITLTRPPGVTHSDHVLVRSLARWHERVTGEVAKIGSLGRLGSAADGSHTAGAGMDTVLYGPGGGQTDKEYRLKGHLKTGPPDERILLKDVITTAKVLALTAADICG